MVYDAWNRLAAVYADDGTAAGEKDASDTLIAEYRYDGRHRRIAKIEPDAAHSGKYVRTDYYYSLGWQVVEERRDDDLASKDTVASTLKYQYVWGVRYIDAPVCRDEDKSDGSGGDPDGDCIDADDEHLYYTQDANFNVTALVDGSDGDVLERYMYSPYGEVTVLHGDRDSSGTDTSADEWSARTSNTFENALLYCGYYHDWETGLYHVRHRYYHSPLGRWTSRDPSGYADGMGLYEYVGGGAVALVDPFGYQGAPPSEGRMPALGWLPQAEDAFQGNFPSPREANNAIERIIEGELRQEHPDATDEQTVVGGIRPFSRAFVTQLGQAALFFGTVRRSSVYKHSDGDGKCYCDFSEAAFYYKAAILYKAGGGQVDHVLRIGNPKTNVLSTGLLQHERMHITGNEPIRRGAHQHGAEVPEYVGYEGVAKKKLERAKEELEKYLKKAFDTEAQAAKACDRKIKSLFRRQGALDLTDPKQFARHAGFHGSDPKHPRLLPVNWKNPGEVSP